MLEESRVGSDQGWSRREFARAVVGASSVALGLGQVAGSEEPRADSILARFCRSMNPEQRRSLVFPFDDPKRTSVQNHWAIVPAPIASLTAAQQEMALGLVRQVCTPEGFAALTRTRDDDAGGWKHDHIAVFGSPDEPGRFEWVLTGRHLTLRGSSTGVISGGPLFFGHSAQESNLGDLQTERVGSLFRSLDAQQQDRALVFDGQGEASSSGLTIDSLDLNQQVHARRLLASLSEPFQAFEVPSVQACLQDQANGLRGFRWQRFRTDSCRDGDSPTVWRFVGPGFAWSFHGEPHVHSWFDSV